ncbi:MAG: spiro-SPASM protein [Spirochaetes bacterium]|nr:spiro-SPASM protein [Spirochaetota bacterium]
MKDLVIIDATLLAAQNILPYTFLPLCDNKHTFQLTCDKALSLDGKTILHIPKEKNELTDKMIGLARSHNIESYISTIPIRNNKDLYTSLAQLSDKKKASHIILLYADSPLIDIDMIKHLARLHKEGLAEYTFGDNFAQGLVGEVMSKEFLNKIKDSEYKKPDVVSRQVFDCMNADINKFFIELAISENDFSGKRLSLTASSKRNVELLKNIGKTAGWTADSKSIWQALEKYPQSLHIFPKYVEIEITNHCNLSCPFCPRSKMKRKPEHMNLELMKKIIHQLTDNYKDIVISFGLMGEPLLHPDFLKIVDLVFKSDIFHLIIETNGILFDKSIAGKLSSCPPEKLSVIFGLDAFSPETYAKIRVAQDKKNHFQTVKQNIEYFLDLDQVNQLRTFLQILKIEENKTELEPFYHYWEQKGVPIIIQKHNSYIKLLKDKTLADLTPLDRFPCWHLQRDMEIFSNGDVPVCKQDINGHHIIGNLEKTGLLEIWNKMKEFFLDNYSFEFKKLPSCKECDEWYTFNF